MKEERLLIHSIDLHRSAIINSKIEEIITYDIIFYIAIFIGMA